MPYIIGVILLFLTSLIIFNAVRKLIVSNPELYKKISKIFLGFIIFCVVIILIRVGLPIIAATFGAIMALMPHMHKVPRFLYLFNLFKEGIAKGGVAKKASNNNDVEMTKEVAYEILELDKNATKDDIEDAYKKHMKNNHPDRGGSKYLAIKINKARDVLLKDYKKHS